jgi:hypothetical protein
MTNDSFPAGAVIFTLKQNMAAILKKKPVHIYRVFVARGFLVT